MREVQVRKIGLFCVLSWEQIRVSRDCEVRERELKEREREREREREKE